MIPAPRDGCDATRANLEAFVLGQTEAAESSFVASHLSGCEACRRDSRRWVQLRLCLSCGHVGCCDASAPQHATRHFRATGHPIVQTLAAGESWRWCYVDEVVV